MAFNVASYLATGVAFYEAFQVASDVATFDSQQIRLASDMAF